MIGRCTAGARGGGTAWEQELDSSTHFFLNKRILATFADSSVRTMASEAPPTLEGGSPESVGDPAVFGVVTVSDRASAGIYEDKSGPAILNFFHEAIKSE